ncbi:hypothetical protein [Sphingomonas humi]|uniref:DUF2730 family protein n=1 Tax=Sphingomonas humi TaxID=335630 RepID=A0ABP7SBT7_9SPHN
MTAMVFALLFGAWTIYLLIRTSALKRRLRLQSERLAQTEKLAQFTQAPTAALTAAPQRDEEIVELRKRVQVLERITVDHEHSLSREIEELRVR